MDFYPKKTDRNLFREIIEFDKKISNKNEFCITHISNTV